MYFGMERELENDGSVTDNTTYSVNNIYLNGVRIAALTASGETRYYLTDQVDSVSMVFSEQGKPLTSFEYMPYGETWLERVAPNLKEKHNPKFNSQELDPETDFYYYNARYYDPEVSRFVTADTVIDGEQAVFGWNRYMYVKGNPIQYNDPSGHEIYSINRELGGTEVRSTYNLVSHTYLATTDNHKQVKDVYSWGKVNTDDEKQGSWHSSTLDKDKVNPLNREAMVKEKRTAGSAIYYDEAVKLTKDDKLDKYMTKAVKLLEQDDSPSKHKWSLKDKDSQIGISNKNVCKGESELLFGTALDIYKQETGNDYKGVSAWGVILQRHMDEKQFEKMYNTANGKDKKLNVENSR